MGDIKNFIDICEQKDMISQLLSMGIIDVPEEDREEVANKVYEKLKFMNELRNSIEENDSENINNVAQNFGVDKNKIIDAFIHFFMIVENAILTKTCEELSK